MPRRASAGRSTARAPLSRSLLAGVLLLALSSCTTDVSKLAFRQDTRLQFTAPERRALIQPPLTISWSMRDFQPAGAGSARPSRGAGYFGVFVDRAPIRPGQTLAALAKGDRSCQALPGCPDAAYFAKREIYTTTQDSIRIADIKPFTDSGDTLQLHFVTVVLLDTSGRRIGESSWTREFKMRARAW